MAKGKKLSFEAQLLRLQEIVGKLEQHDIPLEEGLALYKEGLGLSADCRQRLESARNEVQILQNGKFTSFSATVDADDSTFSYDNEESNDGGILRSDDSSKKPSIGERSKDFLF